MSTAEGGASVATGRSDAAVSADASACVCSSACTGSAAGVFDAGAEATEPSGVASAPASLVVPSLA